MLHRLLLVLVPSLSLLLLVIGCSSVASGPDQDASGTPVTAAFGDTSGAANSPTEPEPEASADCLGNSDLKKIRAEYTANPLRADRMYGTGRMCLEGRITSFLRERGGAIAGVNTTFGDNFGLQVTERTAPPIEWERWREWLISVSVGDVIEVECEIYGLRQPKKGYTYTPGTPILDECMLVDSDGKPLLPTSTPEPTWTPEPTPIPKPTRTPQPSPTPTKTPLPTPTFTLLERTRMNAGQCAKGGSEVGGKSPKEILPQADGSAFVKAAYYTDPGGRRRVSGGTTAVPPESPPHYRYWRYEPGPATDAFTCEAISYLEYPAPTLTTTEGEARIEEVANLADESCRNWIRAWREGNTFLDTQAVEARGSQGYGHRFSIEEIRPVNEGFALVLVNHRYGVRDWNDQHDAYIYIVYDVGDNSCRETEYAGEAWFRWPGVPPELKR